MTPRVLITGGTGLLGQALLHSTPNGWEVAATFHRQLPPTEWRHCFRALDVRDEAAVLGAVSQFRPTVVIHSASIGSVDLAERDPDSVRRVNVGGLQAVARACERAGARMALISSNAVFDGSHPPYAEDAARRAVNAYGAIKIEAEEWLEQSGLPYLIFRPIMMYGWPLPGGRSNAVTRWLAELEAGRSIDVASDIFSMPLFVSNGAAAIWEGLKGERRGLYHLAGADRVALVDFAREAARVFGCPDSLVVPVPSSSFAGLAPRPLDTSFVTTRMTQELGVRPIGIREGLLAMQRTRQRVASR
jgi:dTDP-4-dehydrorhamnose reductase